MAAGDVVWPVFALFEVRGKGRPEGGAFTREEGGVTETVEYGAEYRLERYSGGDEEQVHQVTVSPHPSRQNLDQFDEANVSRGDFVQVLGEAVITAGGKGRFRLQALIGPLNEDGTPKAPKRQRETATA